jgi:hypothetical protein
MSSPYVVISSGLLDGDDDDAWNSQSDPED